MQLPFLLIFKLLLFCWSSILALFVLFLVVVISLSLLFFMQSSSRLIDVSTLSSILAIPLLPFLDTYSLSSLGCKAFYIVMSFLVFWSICWSSLVHFLKWSRVSILQGEQPKCLSIWWDFWYSLVFDKFSRLLKYALKNFPFISACLMVSASSIPMYL